MNSLIMISFGLLVGGVSTSLYFNRKMKTMVSQILDIKTVNNLLKEHTVKQDEKKKSKTPSKYKSTKRRKPSGDKPATKS